MAEKLRKPAKPRGRGRPFAKGADPRRARGRPLLGDAAAEMVRAVLAEKGSDGVENGKAILRKMVSRAKAGDVKAAMFLFDRGFGKAAQPITGPDGGPHTIIVKRGG